MKSIVCQCSKLSSALFSLIIILMLNSCQEAPQKNPGIIIKDGLIYIQGEVQPFTGHVKDTVQEKIIEYDVLNGMKHGEFRTYFKNGKIEMIGQIKENMNQGTWKYYYKSGQLESEGNFLDDVANGKWKWFYENGNIKEEGVFVKGNREGVWKTFSVDGALAEEIVYKQNQITNKK